MKKKLLICCLSLISFGSFSNAQNYVGCEKLVTLKLPSCTTIGDNAFEGCKLINYVSFPESEPPVYGFNAFSSPENITLEIQTEDEFVISKWMEHLDWNKFQWSDVMNISILDDDVWQFTIVGNKVVGGGFSPNEPIGFIHYSGLKYVFMPSQDGVVDAVLPAGIYIVSQKNTNKRILIK